MNGTEELYKLGESALLNTIDPPLSPGILKMAGVFKERLTLSPWYTDVYSISQPLILSFQDSVCILLADFLVSNIGQSPKECVPHRGLNFPGLLNCPRDIFFETSRFPSFASLMVAFFSNLLINCPQQNHKIDSWYTYINHSQ